MTKPWSTAGGRYRRRYPARPLAQGATPRTEREVYTITARDIGFHAVSPNLCRLLETELREASAPLALIDLAIGFLLGLIVAGVTVAVSGHWVA